MAVDIQSPWRIGPVEIPSRVVLAPMAGVSVQAFRRQGRRFGAGLVCSEMVSCAGLSHGNERTLGYLRLSREEAPLAVQIFGSEPGVMVEAARMVEDAGADIVDINFGCPVRKVTKTGAGATLLEDPGARRAHRLRGRLGGLRPRDREDAPRPRQRLACGAGRRAQAGRGGRGLAHASPPLGQADVHGHGRPLTHDRARRDRGRAGDRLRRRHHPRARAGAARRDRLRRRHGRARRAGEPVGGRRDRRHPLGRADPARRSSRSSSSSCARPCTSSASTARPAS